MVRNMKVSDAAEVLTKSSPYSVAETVARFNEVVAAKDMKVFPVINHSGEASGAGLDLPETRVIIFGSPGESMSIMESVPLMALELPLKVLVWEDSGKKVWVSYNTPEFLIQRHSLPADLAKNISGVEGLIKGALGIH